VEPPQKDLRLIQVSVGIDAVWAITHDGGVWFRKGIQGEISGVCEQLATGTGWVEMLSKMALISVAPNDQVTMFNQFATYVVKKIENYISNCIFTFIANSLYFSIMKVWAIGYDDRCLYYRTGITRSELTGKRWKLINAPLQLSRASSNASLSSSNRHSTCGTPQQQRHQSWSSLVGILTLFHHLISKSLDTRVIK